MSVTLSVKAFADKDSKEFQKHFNAVKFCVENELSYPIETSKFFEGKVDGENLDDLTPKYALECLENGMELDLHFDRDRYSNEVRIKVSDIPEEANEIIIRLV